MSTAKYSANALRGLLNNFYRQPYTLASARTVLLNKDLKQDDAQKIMDYIRRLNQQSPQVYRMYLTGIARRGDEAALKTAIENVNRMGLSGEWRDMYALSYATQKDSQKTIDTLSQLVQEGKWNQLSMFDFSFMMSKFVNEPETTAKFAKLYEDMRAQGMRPHLLVANVMLRASARESEEAVRKELAKMKADGLQPNAQSYTGIMFAHMVKDDVEGARKWLDEMKREGIKPESAAYGQLGDSAVRKKDFEELQKIMEEMKREGVKIDFRFFSALILAKANQKDKKAAEHWNEEMMKEGWSPSIKIKDALGQL